MMIIPYLPDECGQKTEKIMNIKRERERERERNNFEYSVTKICYLLI